MKKIPPKVAAVHDLACFGRCSLAVIMPVLSAMGVQVCPLPTAVFSTHLGGFTQVVCHDFADRMTAFFQHWQREGLAFDCLYSGFLASEAQFAATEAFLTAFRINQPLVLVDPVMGDHGRLYSSYTETLCQLMRGLVRQADVITPNYTEACILLGETYQETEPEVARLQAWCRRLSDMGPRQVVITGVPAGDALLNIGYDRRLEQDILVSKPQVAARYPGTGDLFASALLGRLLQGDTFARAIETAAEFVSAAVAQTFAAGTPPREGVLFETVLAHLIGNGEDENK